MTWKEELRAIASKSKSSKRGGKAARAIGAETPHLTSKRPPKPGKRDYVETIR